jgi:hypothetical protein
MNADQVNASAGGETSGERPRAVEAAPHEHGVGSSTTSLGRIILCLAILLAVGGVLKVCLFAPPEGPASQPTTGGTDPGAADDSWATLVRIV